MWEFSSLTLLYDYKFYDPRNKKVFFEKKMFIIVFKQAFKGTKSLFLLHNTPKKSCKITHNDHFTSLFSHTEKYEKPPT